MHPTRSLSTTLWLTVPAYPSSIRAFGGRRQILCRVLGISAAPKVRATLTQYCLTFRLAHSRRPCEIPSSFPADV